MKRILTGLFELMMFGFLATAFAASFNTHWIVGALIVIALLFVGAASKKQTPYGLHKNDIALERWQDYLQERFFKDNCFMQFFDDHNGYVIEGKTVHIPNKGSKPTVHKNPTSFPLTVEQRTDTIVSYDLDWYITAPTQVTNAEEAEVSYDKMDDVMGDHVAVQSERAADEMLIKALDLLPAANIIRTSGGGGDNPKNSAPKIAGQVGNRLIFHPNDLRMAKLKMNLWDIPKVDRYALLESNCLDELVEQMSDTQYNAFNQYYNEETGVIGRLHGFKIMERSSVAIAANDLNGSSQLAVDAYGAAVGATDQVVNLLWYKKNVARAMGTINVMHNPQRSEYGGDIMNCDFRFGGRRKYANGIGVVAIVQQTAS